mgnify:CR=1 FL=1
MTQLDIADRYDQMNQVVEIYLKGNTNETKIAEQLSIKRSEVVKYLAEWRQIAANDQNIQMRAREALGGMDKHYNMILDRLWETVEQADLNSDLRTKSTTLKQIADVEKQRLDALQKAGIFNDQEMADQIAEMERQRDILVGIIKEVSSTCPNCKNEVARRLSKLNPNKPEPIDITEQVVVSPSA